MSSPPFLSFVKHPFFSLIAISSLFVWAFHVAGGYLFRFGSLPPEAFNGSSIVAYIVIQAPVLRVFFLAALLLAILTIQFKWSDFRGIAVHLRYPALSSVFCLCWFLTTTEYNYWHESYFGWDRFILLALAVTSFFRPGFIGLFVIVALSLTSQFNAPFFYSWTDKTIMYELLVFMAGATGLQWMLKDHLDPRVLYIVLFAIIGHWYLLPGIGKLEYDWLQLNELSNLLKSSYFQTGWLGGLSHASRESLFETTAKLNTPFLWITLMVEMGVLLYLFSRKLAIAIPIACIFLHLGIFAFSGIFFWKWVVIDLTLAFAVIQIDNKKWKSLFGAREGALCALLIGVLVASSPRVMNLAWLDSPYSFQFSLIGKGESGANYELIASDLAPFDLPVAQQRFYFLTTKKQLVGTYGTTLDRNFLRFFQQNADLSLDQLKIVLENKYGHGLQNPELISSMNKLMENYLRRINQQTKQANKIDIWIKRLSAPHHIHTRQTQSLPRFDFQEPLTGIDVRLAEAVHRKKSFVVFDEKIHEFSIGSDQKPKLPIHIKGHTKGKPRTNGEEV